MTDKVKVAVRLRPFNRRGMSRPQMSGLGLGLRVAVAIGLSLFLWHPLLTWPEL